MAAYKSIGRTFRSRRLGPYRPLTEPCEHRGSEVGLNFDLGKSLTLAAYGACWRQRNTAIDSTVAALPCRGWRASSRSLQGLPALKGKREVLVRLEGDGSAGPVRWRILLRTTTRSPQRQIRIQQASALYQIVDFSGEA